MAIEPKVAQTHAVIDDSRRQLETLRAAIADAWASIEESLKLLPVEETRALAEKVSNAKAKALLFDVAEIQDRMREDAAPG